MAERDYMAIVRQMLAKAESTEHEAEAEAFMAKAEALMAKHAIDAAMLAEHDDTARSKVTKLTMVCDAPYASPKSVLLGQVAKANGCQAVRTAKAKGQATMIVFGYQVDLDHVQALYTSLSLQATRAMLRQSQRSKRFRHSFLLSFAARVGTRLQEARRQAERDHDATNTEGRSAALVLADRRDQVQTQVEEMFPDLETTKVRGSSREGYAAGDRAGREADIGHQRLSGRRMLGGGR